LLFDFDGRNEISSGSFELHKHGSCLWVPALVGVKLPGELFEASSDVFGGSRGVEAKDLLWGRCSEDSICFCTHFVFDFRPTEKQYAT
jgi:hypothetical protein